MKLICSKANLLCGVNIVSKAVPTRTTMAILECILIDASANEIKLMANDMELGIETKIEGEIAERGHSQNRTTRCYATGKVCCSSKTTR